ncbi:MAG: Clp protease N-terminal domain-containing protein, partial [Deltaproteobacteria bacterium]
MRTDKLTVKSQEALNEAVEQARQRGHQEVACAHLAVALLRQRDGLVPAWLERAHVGVYPLIRALEAELDKLYQVQGGRDALGQPFDDSRLAHA